MTRIKRGTQAHNKHKKILEQASGYYGARSRVFRVAKQAVIKAGQYSYRDRKVRKRFFRSLWITRINAQLAQLPSAMSYSVFMHKLQTANLGLNRKSLAELAMFNPNVFNDIVKQVNFIEQ